MQELLKKRRSIRQFTEQPIEIEKIQLLKNACLRSPTGHRLQNWRFVFVTNPKLISKLSEARTNGSTFLKGAKLVVVIAGLSQESDVWIENDAIAATILQLQAQDLGLGSCWVQVRNRFHDDQQTTEEYLKKTLELPTDWSILCMIGLGYPTEELPPRDLPENEKQIIWER